VFVSDRLEYPRVGCVEVVRLRVELSEQQLRELYAAHTSAIKLFFHVYNDFLLSKEAYNTGLRIMGLLSGIISITSRTLGLRDDVQLLRRLVRRFHAGRKLLFRRTLDVEGLVGLALLARNFRLRELGWAERKLREVVRRRDSVITPPLAEARILLGERSSLLYSFTCAAACIAPLDPTIPTRTDLHGLRGEERETVLLCARLRRALATSL